MKKHLLILGLVILAIASISAIAVKNRPINTMLMLIEFEKVDGILQWEKELDKRDLTALVKVQDNVLEKNPETFKRLADKGYEVAGGYDEAPFWDMSYDEQYKRLKESKEKIERITGEKMRVFGSRYFAYDETTLKAADALGIEYILGRGVNDVEATVYQPKEYKTKIISVTNVDVGEPMGRGSLCDYSLWARGADSQEFGKILDESIAKKPNNMIIVSHAYLGGT
ncbi:MAG TPA: polysaccharide deacetylase family protein, partial [Candidatus Colwellbacteria bacterium]|nr:polysaccharide deacetylase family protein [Candidatus Colwellbacteria bacterium]